MSAAEQQQQEQQLEHDILLHRDQSREQTPIKQRAVRRSPDVCVYQSGLPTCELKATDDNQEGKARACSGGGKQADNGTARHVDEWLTPSEGRPFIVPSSFHCLFLAVYGVNLNLQLLMQSVRHDYDSNFPVNCKQRPTTRSWPILPTCSPSRL